MTGPTKRWALIGGSPVIPTSDNVLLLSRSNSNFNGSVLRLLPLSPSLN